jgi:IclR family pca regulon transcriptional regulator
LPPFHRKAANEDVMARSGGATPDEQGAARAADEDYLPSLEKALAVIELFGADTTELTLSQIVRELQITPGSTRRILRTLEILGYAVSDDGRFRLAPRVLSLGFSYLSSQPFAKVGQPLLTALADRLQATCCITVLDGREVVYVARGTHKHIEPFFIHVGARLPAYATAPGKVLLASLDESELERRLEGWQLGAFTPNTITDAEALRRQIGDARRAGYAINDQEIFVGQRSIAVPLFAGGKGAAALVVAVSVSAKSVDQLVSDLLDPLRSALREIERSVSLLL